MWRSNWIWIPILVICLGFLVTKPIMTKKPPIESDSRYELAYPKVYTVPSIATPKKIDYIDIILKLGGLSGALMSCINLGEKTFKGLKKIWIVRRKNQRKLKVYNKIMSRPNDPTSQEKIEGLGKLTEEYEDLCVK